MALRKSFWYVPVILFLLKRRYGGVISYHFAIMFMFSNLFSIVVCLLFIVATAADDHRTG